MGDNIEFEARIAFLPTEQGGRRGPVCSGYRAPCSFGLREPMEEPQFNDCTIRFVGRDCVSPGEENIARVTPLFPASLREVLRPDTTFEILEGPRRVVAHGVITRVFAHAAPAR